MIDTDQKCASPAAVSRTLAVSAMLNFVIGNRTILYSATAIWFGLASIIMTACRTRYQLALARVGRWRHKGCHAHVHDGKSLACANATRNSRYSEISGTRGWRRHFIPCQQSKQLVSPYIWFCHQANTNHLFYACKPDEWLDLFPVANWQLGPCYR